MVDIYGELQRAILNNIPDQAWLKDKDSRYVLVNEAFLAACGRPEHEILGRTPDKVWSTDWGLVYLRTDQAVVSSGRRSRYEESRIAADGVPRWFDTVKTPIRDAAGHVIGTVGISRDITDRRQAQEELLESRSRLRELSAYLQSVREAERTRFSRELHDELGQSLTALRLGLNFLETHPLAAGDTAWRQHVCRLKEIADSTLDSVQRIAADLRPPVLDELGLVAAIEWLAESFAERSGLRCVLQLPRRERDFGPEISTGVFRIVQEALTNARRHGHATAVTISLDERAGMLHVVVADDGCGIDASPAKPRASLGLLGMRERALMLGGRLTVCNQETGGTRVEAHIPMAQGARRSVR